MERFSQQELARAMWGANAVWDLACVVGMWRGWAWVPHLRCWRDEEERQEARGPAMLLVGWWGITRALGCLNWHFMVLARASYAVEALLIGVLVAFGRVSWEPGVATALLCLAMGMVGGV